VHKEAVHLLSLRPASITSSGTFKHVFNGLSQFKEDTGGPSMPVQECKALSALLHESLHAARPRLLSDT